MGRLQLNKQRKIGPPEHVLQWIEYGVSVLWKQEPPSAVLSNRVHGQQQCNFITAELKRLLQQGAIEKCEGWQPQCILPIQCIPKKNGKLRLALDCRYVKRHIKAPKFTQEGINGLSGLVQEGDDLTTADIKDGFHHVRICTGDQKYLSMRWGDHFYVWKVLPFGMLASPYFFNKVLRPVETFLREINLQVSLFMDDFCQSMRPEKSQIQTRLLCRVLERLGWTLNYDKSQLIPAKIAVFFRI